MAAIANVETGLRRPRHRQSLDQTGGLRLDQPAPLGVDRLRLAVEVDALQVARHPPPDYPNAEATVAKPLVQLRRGRLSFFERVPGGDGSPPGLPGHTGQAGAVG